MKLIEVYGNRGGHKVQIIGHLSQLKKLRPAAFKAFVEMLVEDCDTEFSVTKGGKFMAHNSDGTMMAWNPNSTAGDVGAGWELEETEEID